MISYPEKLLLIILSSQSHFPWFSGNGYRFTTILHIWITLFYKSDIKRSEKAFIMQVRANSASGGLIISV